MKTKALLLLVVVTQLTCHQALFTAPPGSVIVCTENPRFISAFNGVSVISCIVTEPAGTLVSDGTVVQFFTTLGRIPEQGRTNDGVVRVNLEADGRSGTANGIAVSGGASVAPPSSSNPGSTSPTSTTVIPERGSVSRSSAAVLASAGALQNSDDFMVTIGNTNVVEIVVTAFPPRLTDSRTSQITANVFDAEGNPVGGVPVFFAVTDAVNATPTPPSGTPTPTPSAAPTATPTGGTGDGLEHMDSQGQPVFTDSNGQARDVMRTRYARGLPQRTVTVEARVPVNDVSGTTRVIIN